MADLAAGKRVRHKSGGPLMVIAYLEEDGAAWCEWFDKNNNPQGKSFLLTSLEEDDGGPRMA